MSTWRSVATRNSERWALATIEGGRTPMALPPNYSLVRTPIGVAQFQR